MSDSSDEAEPFQLRDYEDEDTDDERPNKRRKTMRPLRGRGMGFVKSTAADEETADKSQDDEEDVDDERPTMGGFRSSFNIGEFTGQLGREESPQPVIIPQPQNVQPAGGSGPSAFGAGGRIQKNSFAARMMAKQGYVEGQGLGKSGQGITAPIEAKKLQSRAGLGVGGDGPDPPRKQQNKDKPSRVSTPGASTPRLKAPPKAKYAVTAIESRGLLVPDAMKSMIIDATGAETKTITSLSGFSTPTRETSPSLETSKATSRIKLQLQAYADAWDATKEHETRLTSEDQQLQAATSLYDSENQRFNNITAAFERVTVDDSNEARDWDQVIDRLQQIQELYSDQLEELDLGEIAAACLETPLRREIVNWEPLNQPEYLISSLQSIGALLDLEKSITSRNRKRTTYYESLLLLHWYPTVRNALQHWDVYNPDPATTLITTWTSILPPWLMYKLAHECILPKLIEAVRRFPKIVESPTLSLSSRASTPTLHTTNGNHHSSSKRSKKTLAPDLHSWLFDWWSLLSSEDLELERFPELRSLVKSKIDGQSWPIWKPLLGSRTTTKSITTSNNNPSSRQQKSHPSSRPETNISTPSAAELLAEEMSFKDYVEEWCSQNDLLLQSTPQSDAMGRRLYRLQGADALGRSGKGILVYLQDDVVFAAADGEPFALDESLVAKAMGKS